MKKSLLTILFFLLVLVLACDEVLEKKITPEETQLDSTGSNKNQYSNAKTGACTPGMDYSPDNNGYPIGGGGSYPNLINTGDIIISSNSIEALHDALVNASPNTVIFIESNVTITINSPDYLNLPIKQGVTLASYRGNGSCGALIRVTEDAGNGSIFVFEGSNTRITGLRFEGPSSQTTFIESLHAKKAIDTDGFNDITIDNNEIYNWPMMGIVVSVNDLQSRYSSNNVIIRNNYFHDNRGSGWGYGVALGGDLDHRSGDNPFALIKGNLFERNRHDISSSGLRGSGYEASYNVVLGGNTNANFDVHGGCDLGFSGDDSFVAGTFMHIHHNIFFKNELNPDNNLSFSNIIIKGIPEYMALIHNNRFENDIGLAILQGANAGTCVTLSFNKHVFALNNAYGYSNGYEYRGMYASRTSSNYGTLPPYNTVGWIDRNGDQYKDFEMMDFALGDFNGDGVTEIFKIDSGGYWYKKPIPEPETGIANKHWGNQINFAPSFTYSQLVFKDFDGNGTDVFKTNLVDWEASFEAITQWTYLNHVPNYSLTQLKFGDFNGDGRTDILKSDNGAWYVSFNGQSSWCNPGPCPYKIMESTATALNLAIGDFNDDGKDDLFKISGTNWYYSNGASTDWILLSTGNGGSVSDLFFIDMDNDGKTDVLKKNSGFYMISWSGMTPWLWFTTTNPTTILNTWD